MEYFIGMKNFIIYLNITALLCVLCGCKKPHQKPPTERMALTVRFFDSIAAKDSATAVRQGQKLYDVDNSQDYIRRLIEVQESNEAIGKAQELIKKGKIAEAVAVINEAKKQYPANQTLNAALIQLEGLKNFYPHEKCQQLLCHARGINCRRSQIVPQPDSGIEQIFSAV